VAGVRAGRVLVSALVRWVERTESKGRRFESEDPRARADLVAVDRVAEAWAHRSTGAAARGADSRVTSACERPAGSILASSEQAAEPPATARVPGLETRGRPLRPRLEGKSVHACRPVAPRGAKRPLPAGRRERSSLRARAAGPVKKGPAPSRGSPGRARRLRFTHTLSLFHSTHRHAPIRAPRHSRTRLLASVSSRTPRYTHA